MNLKVKFNCCLIFKQVDCGVDTALSCTLPLPHPSPF